MLLSILLIIFGLVCGFGLTFLVAYIREGTTSKKIDKMLSDAEKNADKIKRDAVMEAKEKSYQLKLEVDKDIKEKKSELKDSENKLLQRESSLDKRDELCQRRESTLDEREEKLIQRQKNIQEQEAKVEEIKKQQISLLEEISGYSKEKAHDLIMKNVKESMSREIAIYISEQENDAKMTADKKAQEMIVSSMQKYAADIASGETVTVVSLPNDDMKGRLIGREGRNIRTIEAVTGVDLIIDDTPEAVVLSSFDPLRREMARLTLETLIKDGRVHPTRIEEVYDKVCKETKDKILEYGNSALFELGITKMAPELIELIGRLHFRTSYGQNALQHSLEVANLAGLMAGEIGEDVSLAKRAGLLHDIGKAVDHEIEGSHVSIGIELAKKYGENEVVINAIASHHGDTEPTSVISSLVAVADALSASRPGARNDSLENYVKRLAQLEEVANDIEGVSKAYAMQAGRELRVIVEPDEIDDLEAHRVARDIKEKIESTLNYPGTIKITVVRETRAVEEAK
ncbi:MAG TPA: ribonuclease Y [Candidatus Onthousia faecipullorum]|uniref:Ribonuclease Y n=1 Tax=Candidatus Onthousia faecipullorum TaxID=2840887 RepID=A0A9D1GC39_9FIRM|nr:ribonuclease Y [Candidatus Onthousia faecipullorum]